MKKRVSFIKQDRTIISEKVKEAFSSVLPITLIVLVLCFTIIPIDSGIIFSLPVDGVIGIREMENI